MLVSSYEAGGSKQGPASVNTLTVAALQMGMHMPLTRKEFRSDFERFLKVAVAKQSNLVVGSELGAAMIGLPFVDRKHRESLLNIRKGKGARAGLLTRIRGSAERLNPKWSDADTPRLLQRALKQHREEIRDFYDEVFGQCAAQYKVVLVAPSAYLADPVDDEIRQLAGVYDTSGERVGYQTKVLLTRSESNLARPGTLWKPIETSAGVLGIALGFDGLLPEVGRLHVTQGSSLLVHQHAPASPIAWSRAHQAAIMRCVENQLFLCLSSTVGPDRLSADPDLAYAGRSMLLAPLELSPAGNGILVRMENTAREGLVVSDLDYRALQQTWQQTVPAFRQEFSRVWRVYNDSQTQVDDMDRMLPSESLAEDMVAEDVTIVEARTTPLVTESPDEGETEAVAVQYVEEENGVLSEAPTLDDLHVVGSQEFSWFSDSTDEPAHRRPGYQSKGSLDETQELDSVSRAED